MEITPIGWLVIPLGILLFIGYPEGLYALTIFFIPFTATSILNSGSGETGAGIQPFMFFGLLLLFHDFGVALYQMKFRFPLPLRRAVLLYILFLFVCGASLAMPIVIDGNLYVPSNGLLSATLEPLVFNLGRVKVFLGLVFGLLLTISIARRNMTPQSFFRSAKIYIVSGVFICMWGVLQEILYLMGTPYPYVIFNNSASLNAQGYDAVLDSIALRRISSVALEPSTLAITLLGMIPFLVIPIVSQNRLFGKYSDLLIGALLLITLVLTTSSTGILGFAAFCILLPFSVAEFHDLRRRILLSFVVVALVTATIYAAVPAVRNFIQETVFNKSGSYSALERGIVVYNDYLYFKQYPILGIGWGSAPTHDTIFGILSNCGLLGLVTFAGLIGYIIGSLWKQLKTLAISRTTRNISCIMLLSTCTTIAAYVSSSLPGGGTFYVILGLAIAALGITTESQGPGQIVHLVERP